MVACLAWGDGATVSHRGGARLFDMAGFEAGTVELTVPPGRQRAGPGIVHRRVLDRVDLTIVDGLPVTTPTRTIIDLAAVAPREAVEEALDDVLRRGLVAVPRLRRRIDALARQGRPGIRAVRALVEARAGAEVPQSVFETRLLRELKAAAIADPVPQYAVRSHGRAIAVVDFAFPEARVAIEADGYRWHSGRVRWERDLARANALTLLGWRTVRVTWWELTARPASVIATVRAVLAGGPSHHANRRGLGSGDLLPNP